MTQGKVEAYMVVVGVDANELTVKVNQLIVAGWEPQGGVSALVHCCMQAMVKRRQ